MRTITTCLLMGSFAVVLGCSDAIVDTANTETDAVAERLTSDTLNLSDTKVETIDAESTIAPDAQDAGDAAVEDTDESDTETSVDVSTQGDTAVPVEPDSEEILPEEEPIPEPDVTPDFSLCSEPGGTMNIYDIQNPDCPDHFDPEPTEAPGAYIFLTDVIVTAVFSDTIFVQEPPGGPYSGLSVYMGPLFTGDVNFGDVIHVEGYYHEYFGNTQLTADSYTFTGQQQFPPEPFVAAHPSHLATDGPLAEMFEGVPVTVLDVETIHTKPDCPNDFNEFLVTGDLRIDDMGVLWDARLGDKFASITGVLHFAFDNHKLEPRDQKDLNWVGKGDILSVSKCIEGDCQVPINNPGTHEVVVQEIMFDPAGQDNGKEWIELFNPGSEVVDVYGWEIRDCADQKFKITGPDLKIPPGGALVVGASVDPVTNGGTPVDVAYGSAFYLPNTVGSVLLFNGPGPTAQLIDQVRYMVFQEWDWFSSGRSIERLNPDTDGTQATSWAPATTPYGTAGNLGTPGY